MAECEQPFRYVVPAGTVNSPWQEDADARARALADKRARELRVCCTTALLESGCVGQFYSDILRASGGTVPYAWAIVDGSLPVGLELSEDAGVIFGTPSATGESTFTVQVTDAIGSSNTKELTIRTVEITTASTLPGATVGTPYSQALTAAGMSGTVLWSIIDGELPPGLELAGDGTISGTPTGTESADFGFTAQMLDGGGAVCSKDFTIFLTACVPQGFITAESFVGNVGWPYSFQILGNNDDSLPGSGLRFFRQETVPDPIVWQLAPGSNFPPGLSINAASGLISGTPTTPGDYEYTIEFYKNGVFQDCLSFSGSSAFAVRNPVSVAEMAALIAWIESNNSFGALVDNFAGVLYTGSADYTQPEWTWVWQAKGFYDATAPVNFRGITIQVNNGLPRTIYIISWGTVGLVYTKSNMSPGVAGTYNENGGTGAPPVLTLA